MRRDEAGAARVDQLSGRCSGRCGGRCVGRLGIGRLQVGMGGRGSSSAVTENGSARAAVSDRSTATQAASQAAEVDRAALRQAP